MLALGVRDPQGVHFAEPRHGRPSILLSTIRYGWRRKRRTREVFLRRPFARQDSLLLRALASRASSAAPACKKGPLPRAQRPYGLILARLRPIYRSRLPDGAHSEEWGQALRAWWRGIRARIADARARAKSAGESVVDAGSDVLRTPRIGSGARIALATALVLVVFYPLARLVLQHYRRQPEFRPAFRCRRAARKPDSLGRDDADRSRSEPAWLGRQRALL